MIIGALCVLAGCLIVLLTVHCIDESEDQYKDGHNDNLCAWDAPVSQSGYSPSSCSCGCNYCKEVHRD